MGRCRCRQGTPRSKQKRLGTGSLRTLHEHAALALHVECARGMRRAPGSLEHDVREVEGGAVAEHGVGAAAGRHRLEGLLPQVQLRQQQAAAVVVRHEARRRLLRGEEVLLEEHRARALVYARR